MMNNSWNLKGDASTYKKYDKGWADQEDKPKPILRHPPQPVQRSGQMSADNPLVQTQQYYKPLTNASRGNHSTAMYNMKPDQDPEVEIKKNKETIQQIREKAPPRDEFSGGYIPGKEKGRGQATDPNTMTVVVSEPPIPKF